MSKRNNENKRAEEILRMIRENQFRSRQHEYVKPIAADLIEPHVQAADYFKEKLSILEDKVENPDLVFILHPNINGVELLNQCHRRLEFATSYEDLLDASAKMISVLMEIIPEDKYFETCGKMQDRFMV